MTLLHRRKRRLVSLLAAGVLAGRERDEVLAHVGTCRRCRADFAELRGVVATIESDGLRTAEPEVPPGVMVARVERALDAAAAPPRRSSRRRLVAVPVAAAVLAAALLLPRVLGPPGPPPGPARAVIPTADSGPPAVSEEALRRIERNVAREHAARYLSEAGEVLVAVSATGSDCPRKDGSVDLTGAPERSRELLEKRRLVLDSGGQAVASAQGVFDDVEEMLRDVAELPSCVKRRDVDRVRHQVEDRQLLMRIRLMTRELEG